ncbi:MAG: histidinol-phosphate transaminase [Candidatus Tectomicrobia bacterium]|nr:histidinol-phosphate transaminase [Candidatus Tectomicrobia bacterium]
MNLPHPAARTRELIFYDAGKPVEEVERELGIAGSIKLASNENPLGPSPRAVQALKDALKGLHRYPDGSGYYLKRALAERFGLTPGHFTLGNGTNEVLENIGKAFLDPGDQAIMADAAFVVFHIVAQLCQAERVVIPLRDYVHDLEAMAERVGPRTKMVFVANPNNPTGTAVGRGRLAAFLDRVPSRVAVVLDEAYAHYPTMPDYPDGFELLGRHPNLFVLRTFSKAYGLAGIRVGFGAGHPDCVRAVEKLREPFNVNHLALAAALAALGDDEHVEKSRRLNAEGLEFLCARLKKMGIPYVPSQANFLLVEVGDGVQVFERLLREGVIVRPVKGYGLPAHVRVTVGLPEENRRFIEALARVLGR